MADSAFRVEFSRRLKALPPYVFVEIDRLKQRMLHKGVDLIDLGIGDPDTPTPEAIVEALDRAARDPNNHRYPSNTGLRAFREAIAAWTRQRHGLDLDPETEILPTLGSKEAIAHVPIALLDPGDLVLVPDPSYPVYRSATILAGAEYYSLPLRADAGFLPDFGAVPAEVAKRARLLFLNYPNNPTAAVAELDFFQRAVEFARKHDIVIVHDAAYIEVAFDGYRCRSFVEAEGAKEVGLELHSLSKSFNMTGWRIGWAVGNARIVEALAKVKSNMDNGMFQALQHCGIKALSNGFGEWRRGLLTLYQTRRDILCEGLTAAGWSVPKPRGAFYVWAPTPGGMSSAETAKSLLERAGVLCVPGTGYGPAGEGFVRFSLTVETQRLREAVERIRPLAAQWRPA